MKRIIIAPSLLAADPCALGDAARRMEEAGADMLHLDIMDGHFVPNLSYGPHVVAAMRKATKLPLDVHLMVERPGAIIPAFADAGADYISVHAEADPHLHRLIDQIRGLGVKPGLVLNPATHESAIEYLLPHVDLVLCMTVNPGFGGQPFLPLVLPKILRIREILDKLGSDALLQVDGGVGDKTLPELIAAGADTFVAGSALYSAENPAEMIASWRKVGQAC